MRKIDLTLNYLADGQAIPTRYTDQENVFWVASIGRGWEDEIGTHLLVLTTQGATHELIHACEDGQWYLKIIPGPKKI